jgi:hypothetical protein
MVRRTPAAARWLLAAGLALLAPAGAARADDAETRDFAVVVDGKRAGEAHMTIQRLDDGTVEVRCDTDVTVKIGPFRAYSYSYRGQEVWKAGRLVRLASTCNDDGKRFAVTADADGDRLRVRVNGQERLARGDVWLTSYWEQPGQARVDQAVPLLDADTGRDLAARLQLVGAQQMAVAGAAQDVNHYRLTGQVQVDLWYDAAGRLARQEWVEEGHRTRLELIRVRR